MNALAFDLRKPEEVKEYMSNLQIEYQFQCYKESLADGCHRLADFFEAFKKDLPKARSIYKHSCDTYRHPLSCYKHANYSLVGKAGVKDVAVALRDYGHGCDGGHMQSCYNAALVLQSDQIEKEDYLGAKKFLELACEKSHVESCNLLSAYYIRGKPDIPKDMSKAFEYAKMSCDKGHIYGCANVSVMYKKGEGVELNKKLSEQYKKRAKDLYACATEPERTIEFGK